MLRNINITKKKLEFKDTKKHLELLEGVMFDLLDKKWKTYAKNR